MKDSINDSDLNVCETSCISDQIISASSVREQSLLPVVQLSSSTAWSNEKYTRGRIRHILKHNKTQYVVLDDMNSKRTTICWCSFAFSAKLDSNHNPRKIEDFVSCKCKTCFITYSHVSNSTTFLKKHRCESSHQIKNFTSSSSRTLSTSQSLITAYGYPKTVRLPDSHSKEMMDLVWSFAIICRFSWNRPTLCIYR